MKSRCENPAHNRFHTYGARGITVDASWQTFGNFYLDMFSTWQKGKQIDRIDVNKGYSKENCRWVTRAENAQNRTNNRLTREQADEIRRRYLPGTANQEKLAAEFGVSSRMVRYIGDGKAWK